MIFFIFVIYHHSIIYIYIASESIRCIIFLGIIKKHVLLLNYICISLRIGTQVITINNNNI